MSIRLGLIGVEDNLELIRSVAGEYPEFSCLPLLHSRGEEVIDLIKSHEHEVDMWVFSGYYPYLVAKEWDGVNQPMFFVPYTGSSLYKTIYHILYYHKINIDKVSYDGFTNVELQQIFEELSIDNKQIHLKEYENSIADVVEHHFRLWREKKTKAAITCMWTVKNELKQLGVPVFRVTPAKSSIQSVLNMALRTFEMLRFKDMQIAVQMFEIDIMENLSKEMYSSDEIYHLEMKNTQKLLTYAKRIQGSLKTVGPGHFVIFTTRGSLGDLTQNFSVMPEMEEINKGAVTCGIGIGQSAYEAEIHAGKALLHARKHGKGAWMVFFDNKTINGPLGEPERITFSYDTRKFQAISQETTLSVATLSKIDAILKKIGKIEITAHELANQLQILPRSARRIILQLEKKGFAEAIGEENPHPRGRPRRLYRILL